MSQVDQKRAFNKLKHDLEPFRNVIVHLDSLLAWEKQFYPAIICVAISAFFLLLWLMDLSTVTMLALTGLLGITFDFVYPSVSRFLFSPDNWSGNQEMQFEQICNQLCAIKMSLTGWHEFLFNTKERKSTMFVICMSISLLALAWVGAIINNLLLMFLIALSVSLYPGIKEKHIFTEIKGKFGGVVNSKIQQLREKTKKSE